MTRTEEVRRFWEEKRDKALERLNTARGKQTIKKLNREIQVCDMYLRDLKESK